MGLASGGLGASYTKLNYVPGVILEIFSYEIHKFLWSIVVVLLLNVKPELLWQIFNKNISQKILFSVLFLDLKFCKNLRLSLSEHCEWGIWYLIHIGHLRFWRKFWKFGDTKKQILLLNAKPELQPRY